MWPPTEPVEWASGTCSGLPKINLSSGKLENRGASNVPTFRDLGMGFGVDGKADGILDFDLRD